MCELSVSANVRLFPLAPMLQASVLARVSAGRDMIQSAKTYLQDTDTRYLSGQNQVKMLL